MVVFPPRRACALRQDIDLVGRVKSVSAAGLLRAGASVSTKVAYPSALGQPLGRTRWVGYPANGARSAEGCFEPSSRRCCARRWRHHPNDGYLV